MEKIKESYKETDAIIQGVLRKIQELEQRQSDTEAKVNTLTSVATIHGCVIGLVIIVVCCIIHSLD